MKNVKNVTIAGRTSIGILGWIHVNHATLAKVTIAVLVGTHV